MLSGTPYGEKRERESERERERERERKREVRRRFLRDMKLKNAEFSFGKPMQMKCRFQIYASIKT
jgi:hypothetical protein